MRLAACVAIFGEAPDLHDAGCLRLREDENGNGAPASHDHARDSVAGEPEGESEPAL